MLRARRLIATTLLLIDINHRCSCAMFGLDLAEKVFTYAKEEVKDLERQIGYNEDSIENFTVITEKNGYKSEAHTVVTDDGYILTVFRIPRGKNCEGPLKKTPILLMHGLLDSSDTYIIAGPGVALAYILADQCYDVWCGNNRGNRYSRQHEKLNPDTDGIFWDFSFDQIGLYDLPAMIDYILDKTGTERLNYIGHSQGTAIFFILASTHTEYNDKIKLAIALAPVAWMYNMYSPMFQLVSKATPEIKMAAGLAGLKEIFGSQQNTVELMQFICQYAPQDGCGTLMLVYSGYNTEKTNTETIRAGTGHFPCGTSVDNLAHFGQGLQVDRFRRYDYGETRNQEVYGSSEPPDFDVTKISTQVALYCGKNDWMVSLKDVAKLRELLPNVVQYTVLEPADWSHLDFVWGDRITTDLAPKLLNCLDSYGM